MTFDETIQGVELAERRAPQGSYLTIWPQFTFMSSKITVDGDCSHESKIHLLLRRKAMANLDSALKSRNVSLLTNVCTVKAMVFLVVMFNCENWIIRKSKIQRVDAFKLWCWRRLLRVPWTARRSNQSVWREINTEYSLEELMLKFQYFGHPCEELTCWKNPDAGKDWSQKEKSVAEDEMVRWRLWFNRHKFEQTPGDSEGQKSLACCSAWVFKASDMTWQLNKNNYGQDRLC